MMSSAAWPSVARAVAAGRRPAPHISAARLAALRTLAAAPARLAPPATRAAASGSGEDAASSAAADGAQAAAAAAAGQGATGALAGAPPPPPRLRQEVGLLAALDVEYTHLAPAAGGRHISLPAEVCVVDATGRVLLYEHCNPLEGRLAQRRWRHVGGAPPPLWELAPPLGEVRAALAALLAGRILVGHHLRKDLKALGLAHPPEATRDTLQYRELQSRRRAGQGRRLRDLAAEKLGRAIQGSGRRHSPREDAQAAMDLYLSQVHYAPSRWGYDDLVEAHLAGILASASSLDSGDEGGASEASGVRGGGEG